MKPRRLGGIVLALAGTFLPGGDTHAQAGAETGSEGIWWEAFAGAGGARLTCDLCDDTHDLGPALGISAGAWATPATRVGVDLGGWTHQVGEVRETIYTAGASAQAHLVPGSGFHVIGGVGWAGYRVEDISYDSVRLLLGVGWDLPLAGSWVVGNRVVLDAASFGSLDNEGTTIARSVGLSVLRAGVYLRHR